MAQPGFSISELVTAITLAKKVYNSFSHTYESAPARIKELTDTLRYFRDTLIDLEAVLCHYDTFYHGQLMFSRKLEECEAFLKEYSELRPDDTETQNEMRQMTIQKVRRVWQTAKMAFDDATSSLRDGLSMELHKLNNFLFLFILKRTVPGTEIAVSSQSPVTPSSRHSDSQGSDIEKFGRLLRQLLDARDSFRTELYLARNSGREPEFSTIYPVLENIWYQLCHRVGFTGQSAPPLKREVILQSSQMAENEFPSFTDQDGACNRLGPVTLDFTMKTEREADNRSGKRPAIIQRYSCKFQRYSVSQGPDGPVFTWSNQDTSAILRHYIPMKVFPHTLHHAVGSPLQIRFLEKEKHRLVLEKHNKAEIDSTPLLVEYRFDLKPQHQQFQEDLRNKDLLRTFEFYTIKSKRSGRYVEAKNQDIKLWRSREYHQLHSLSFYSNAVERRHVEFPICWFDGTMDRNRDKLTVMLYFVQRISKSLPPIVSRKRWLQLPKLPLRRMRSEGTPLDHQSMSVASGTQQSSNASLYDTETSSTYSDDHRFAPSDIASDLNSLFIKFTSSDHYETFSAEFEKLYKLDTPSETFAPHKLPLVREDPGERHGNHLMEEID